MECLPGFLSLLGKIPPKGSLVCCARRTLTTVTLILATMGSVRMGLTPTPASATRGTWVPSAATRLMSVTAALASTTAAALTWSMATSATASRARQVSPLCSGLLWSCRSSSKSLGTGVSDLLGVCFDT